MDFMMEVIANFNYWLNFLFKLNNHPILLKKMKFFLAQKSPRDFQNNELLHQGTSLVKFVLIYQLPTSQNSLEFSHIYFNQ